MKLSKDEVMMIVDLICNEQTHMISKNPCSYKESKYEQLEKLKIKIRKCEVKSDVFHKSRFIGNGRQAMQN